MRQHFQGFFLSSWMSALLVFTPASAQQGTVQYSKDQVQTQVLLHTLEQGHYSPLELNDSLSERIFKLYIKRLDYNKNFLLQSDIAEFKKYKYSIDDQIKGGTEELYKISADILQKRISEAQSYYQDILSKPFDFTVNETLEVDPEKRDFPKDAAAMKELWRKMLKYQTLLRYLDLVEEQKKVKDLQKSNEKPTTLTTIKSDAELEADARQKILKSQNQRFERLLKENDQDRFAKFLNSIATSFEPHTEYFPPAEKENFDIDITGTLEGIGAQLQEVEGVIKVESIVPGSASWKQKELKAEDIILKVAQGDAEPVDVTDMRLDDAVKLIRGKKGTEVRLTVKKPDGIITVIPIIRDVVVIEETYAKSAVLSDEKNKERIGYIYLPKFYTDFRHEGGRTSADDIKKELEKLKGEKVEGIILDLRNNGGGSLQDAVEMAGHFIPQGPVVQVRNRGDRTEVLKDKDTATTYTGPLVVLVNSFSASASEILAAALQDYGRAIIMGSPTSFGKGTVQTFADLDNYLNPALAVFKPLGSLKLTIQKFYRINGGSTQYKGVIPDIILPDAYAKIELGEKTLDYSLPWDTIPAQHYDKWTKKNVDLAWLKKQSEQRVHANETFSLVLQEADRLKKQRDNTLENLNIMKVQDEQAALKKEGDKFKETQKEHPDLKVTGIRGEGGGDTANDATKLEKAKEWYTQINKDIYIHEAMAVLEDIIRKK